MVVTEESASLQVKAELCEVCGACVAVCPEGSLVLAERSVLIDQASCTGCGLCELICPVEAIMVV
jgi:pyruvate ferredoxin oxidoreductase delta subunit